MKDTFIKIWGFVKTHMWVIIPVVLVSGYFLLPKKGSKRKRR